MDVTFVGNQLYFGDTYVQGKNDYMKDRWWDLISSNSFQI